MRAQWVCLIEQRIALYKQSSVNQSKPFSSHNLSFYLPPKLSFKCFIEVQLFLFWSSLIVVVFGALCIQCWFVLFSNKCIQFCIYILQPVQESNATVAKRLWLFGVATFIEFYPPHPTPPHPLTAWVARSQLWPSYEHDTCSVALLLLHASDFKNPFNLF